MKILYFYGLFMFSLSSNAQVTIYLQNNTSSRLENVGIGDFVIGTIEKDSMNSVNIPCLSRVNGKVLFPFAARYKNDTIGLKPNYSFKCGNIGSKVIEEGVFRFGIFIYTDKNGKEYFELKEIKN